MLVLIRFHQVSKRDLQVAKRIAIACGRLSAGGDDGIRTHDPLLAGQVLSQLSYTPILVYVLLLTKIIDDPSKLNNKRRCTRISSSLVNDSTLELRNILLDTTGSP